MDPALVDVLKEPSTVDRFAITYLDLFSLLWNTEHKKHGSKTWIVYTRRFITVAIILTGCFMSGYVIPEYENTCCYPQNETTVADFIYGTCTDPDAPVHKRHGVQKCSLATSSPQTRATIVLFVVLLITSLGLQAYLAFTMRKTLETNEEAQLKAMQDLSSDAYYDTNSKVGVKHMKAHFNELRKEYKRQGSRGSLAPPCVILHQLGHSLWDPFCIWLGLGCWILKRYKALALTLGCLVVNAGALVFYWLEAEPTWAKDCCKTKALDHANMGNCNDPSSPIAHDPDRQACSMWRADLTSVMLLCTILLWSIAMLVPLVIGLWNILTFQRVELKATTMYIDRQRQLVEQNPGVYRKLDSIVQSLIE